jgi:hypothetical protein
VLSKSSNPVDSDLNFSWRALTRTTPTSASEKPLGASASTSSVSFTFAPWVRYDSITIAFRIASKDFTGRTMSISTEP